MNRIYMLVMVASVVVFASFASADEDGNCYGITPQYNSMCMNLSSNACQQEPLCNWISQ